MCLYMCVTYLPVLSVSRYLSVRDTIPEVHKGDRVPPRHPPRRYSSPGPVSSRPDVTGGPPSAYERRSRHGRAEGSWSYTNVKK